MLSLINVEDCHAPQDYDKIGIVSKCLHSKVLIAFHLKCLILSVRGDTDIQANVTLIAEEIQGIVFIA